MVRAHLLHVLCEGLAGFHSGHSTHSGPEVIASEQGWAGTSLANNPQLSLKDRLEPGTSPDGARQGGAGLTGALGTLGEAWACTWMGRAPSPREIPRPDSENPED